jgi:polar amino acid transport system ATP-binding protein
MYLIELSSYSLVVEGFGKSLKDIYFALATGDACAIKAAKADDAHIFLKALATLISPQTGTYRYMGEIMDFSDYRHLLPFKKKIGYVGQDSAMLSNKTVRENLLLMRSYFENSLALDIDEKVLKLCEIFNIQDKLDIRPGELRPVDLRIAIAIRELTKSFDVLLLERPEDYFGYNSFGLFKEILKDTLEHGHGVVFFSNNQKFIEAFANREVLIADGTLANA